MTGPKREISDNELTSLLLNSGAESTLIQAAFMELDNTPADINAAIANSAALQAKALEDAARIQQDINTKQKALHQSYSEDFVAMMADVELLRGQIQDNNNRIAQIELDPEANTLTKPISYFKAAIEQSKLQDQNNAITAQINDVAKMMQLANAKYNVKAQGLKQEASSRVNEEIKLKYAAQLAKAKATEQASVNIFNDKRADARAVELVGNAAGRKSSDTAPDGLLRFVQATITGEDMKPAISREEVATIKQNYNNTSNVEQKAIAKAFVKYEEDVASGNVSAKVTPYDYVTQLALRADDPETSQALHNYIGNPYKSLVDLGQQALLGQAQPTGGVNRAKGKRSKEEIMQDVLGKDSLIAKTLNQLTVEKILRSPVNKQIFAGSQIILQDVSNLASSPLMQEQALTNSTVLAKNPIIAQAGITKESLDVVQSDASLLAGLPPVTSKLVKLHSYLADQLKSDEDAAAALSKHLAELTFTEYANGSRTNAELVDQVHSVAAMYDRVPIIEIIAPAISGGLFGDNAIEPTDLRNPAQMLEYIRAAQIFSKQRETVSKKASEVLNQPTFNFERPL